jgi:hypothetical protein
MLPDEPDPAAPTKKGETRIAQTLGTSESGHIHVMDSDCPGGDASASKAIIFPTLDPDRLVHHRFDGVLNNAYKRRDYLTKIRSPRIKGRARKIRPELAVMANSVQMEKQRDRKAVVDYLKGKRVSVERYGNLESAPKVVNHSDLSMMRPGVREQGTFVSEPSQARL